MLSFFFPFYIFRMSKDTHTLTHICHFKGSDLHPPFFSPPHFSINIIKVLGFRGCLPRERKMNPSVDASWEVKRRCERAFPWSWRQDWRVCLTQYVNNLNIITFSLTVFFFFFMISLLDFPLFSDSLLYFFCKCI